MAVRFAVSTSGHDRNKVYVIVNEDGGSVWLADGVIRTAGRPKRKNLKHVQIIRKIPEEIQKVLGNGSSLSDLNIKRAIKLYVKKQEENECQKQM